jgi:hypothetical protein
MNETQYMAGGIFNCCTLDTLAFLGVVRFVLVALISTSLVAVLVMWPRSPK